MSKTRMNLSIDQDLIDFAKVFAAQNRTSVAEMITQYLLSLKRLAEGENVEKILAHPAFHAAMQEAQEKLRNGTATWYSYDEVFDD